MKFAVFASARVGLQAVETFRDRGQPIDYLAWSEKEDPAIRDAIIKSAGSARVFPYTELVQSISAGKPLIPPHSFDIGLVAWWPHMVSDEILALAKLGFLNFHPSLLPIGRGKNPNFWSLVEDVPFGVTIHWVDSSIDGGDIAFQKPIKKTWLDNGQSLHRRSQEEMINLFREHFGRIAAGDIPRQPQSADSRVRYGKELDPSSVVDLEKSYRARDLLNLLRARTYPGFPGCRFTDNGETYEVRIEIKKIES